MTRQQRRKAERDAVKARRRIDRADAIRMVFGYLEAAAADDPSVSGATLILPSGEVQFLPRPPATGVRS